MTIFRLFRRLLDKRNSTNIAKTAPRSEKFKAAVQRAVDQSGGNTGQRPAMTTVNNKLLLLLMAANVASPAVDGGQQQAAAQPQAPAQMTDRKLGLMVESKPATSLPERQPPP